MIPEVIARAIIDCSIVMGAGFLSDMIVRGEISITFCDTVLSMTSDVFMALLNDAMYHISLPLLGI